MSLDAGYKYVIEHMEDDDTTTHVVPPWVRLEYAQMLKNAGRGNTVLFTSLSSSSAAILPSQLAEITDSATVAECKATTTPILELLRTAGPNGAEVPISKVCLLDPRAERVLSPADGAPGAFEFFLFGGILGDDPPRDRTGELRKLGFETRHLGSVQMTTDTVSPSPHCLLRTCS
jgi:ribosome biogenesis SPOUT family RNA methylase Rps3